jgi:regulator of sirC expression with transglutaminase-like and TPR domain
MNAPWQDLRHVADTEMPLSSAALLVAKDEYPGLSLEVYEARLDEFAAALRAPFADAADDGARLALLNRFLFNELGFAGDELDYFDPRNNYINDVIDRRLGNPISLAVVQLALAQRLGLPLHGVSFPGHFLVSMPLEDGIVVVDPFHRGRMLDLPELRRRARQELSTRSVDDQRLASLLEPADHRAIVVRILHNLKLSYARREAWDKALRCADRILTVNPHDVADLRERGQLYLRVGHYGAAAADLKRYLALAPHAEDREAVSLQLTEALQQAPRLH